MCSLQKKTLMGAAVAVTSLMMSMSSAWAISSCWDASDPPGCWLQCTFDGPCPLDSVAGSGPEIEVDLPNANSAVSQKFAESLKGLGKVDVGGTKKSRELYRNIGGQTCKPEELVEVMTKAVGQSKDHMTAAKTVAHKCFK